LRQAIEKQLLSFQAVWAAHPSAHPYAKKAPRPAEAERGAERNEMNRDDLRELVDQNRSARRCGSMAGAARVDLPPGLAGAPEEISAKIREINKLLRSDSVAALLDLVGEPPNVMPIRGR
jgi:hypothetical protein